MFISCGWGNSGLWRRNGAKRFNYYQRPPMLTGQPPNLPIIGRRVNAERQSLKLRAEIISLAAAFHCAFVKHRSEEHPSELQSLMRISYAVFCLKTKNKTPTHQYTTHDYKYTSTHTQKR